VLRLLSVAVLGIGSSIHLLLSDNFDSSLILKGCDDVASVIPSRELIHRVADDSSQETKVHPNYYPASTEQYVFDHTAQLGLEDTTFPPTCTIWTNSSATPIYQDLQTLLHEFDEHARLIAEFKPVSDIRLLLGSDPEICQKLELHPDGLLGVFPSGQLSYTPKSGYVEPLLPPLRHPRFCLDGAVRRGKVSRSTGLRVPDTFVNWRYTGHLGYLVHDFAASCRSQKITSRNVLLDMGANLDYLGKSKVKDIMAVGLMERYTKFGFPFDHIYAFEVTAIPPVNVFKKLPHHFRAAYHWMK
jgi:hypothetical protein